MSDEEFYELMYRLAYIIRYSNVPRVKDESVAEHSFFVAVLVMKFYDQYKFNLGVALQIAIAHDCPESMTNDLSHETKTLFPEIKDVIKRAEKEFLKQMPYAIKRGVELLEMDTVESKIVALADAMQCHQYSSHEASLGNQGYMTTVLHSSSERIRKLREELKRYER